jgi:DNA (cytosine-5)-methyltransferase 1
VRSMRSQRASVAYRHRRAMRRPLRSHRATHHRNHTHNQPDTPAGPQRQLSPRSEMKVGSLFSGYGGLDMAVGGELAWYCEIEPAACRVLEAHHPGVPNLGNITKINWDEVKRVDIITGGYPCQPFSQAGQRKGKDDERHLWPFVRDAIRTLRPGYAILENVAGHLTLGFGDVLADLAEIGWDAEWTVVRASDVGACHRRERLFILAHTNSARSELSRPRSMETEERGNDVARTVIQNIVARECAGVEEDQDSTGSRSTDYGPYGSAVERWGRRIGRRPPTPMICRPDDRPRLNPVFVEWMMGLPEGHVTGHGLSTSQCLKMLGNGVVPQQAAHAIRHLLQRLEDQQISAC